MSISNRRSIWLDFFLIITYFIAVLVSNAKSAEPDQTSRYAVSDHVYTVCQWSIYGTLDINGFISLIFFSPRRSKLYFSYIAETNVGSATMRDVFVWESQFMY